MESITRELRELECKQQLLLQRLSPASFSVERSPYACGRLLIVLKETSARALCSVMEWLRTHGPACYDENTGLTVVCPWASTFRWTKEAPHQIDPPSTKLPGDFIRLLDLLQAMPNRSICVVACREAEFLPVVVNLMKRATPETQKPTNLVVVSGCRSLSEKEFSAPDYTPLAEEILLKEAIQPIILLKNK